MMIVACALMSCTDSLPRYDLPPPSRAPNTRVVVTHVGNPRTVTPHNRAEGLLGGAAYGAVEDCIHWLCVPVLATTLGVAGLVTGSSSSTIKSLQIALDGSHLATTVGPLLADAVVREGNAMGTFEFVRAAPADSTRSLDGVETSGRDGQTGSGGQPALALNVEAIEAGIVANGFSAVLVLTVKGRLGLQEVRPISYRGIEHAVSFWIENSGANILPALREAIDSVARDIVKTVFQRNADRAAGLFRLSTPTKQRLACTGLSAPVLCTPYFIVNRFRLAKLPVYQPGN